MARVKEPPAASTLLLDEYFEAGDERFLDELMASGAEKRFKRFAERWYGDKRPFARRTLLRYIDAGIDRAHHRPLVKALYKLAEGELDDEVVGHFLVAFDRLPRRKLVRTPTLSKSAAPSAVIVPDEKVPAGRSDADKESRFSRATRQYLCRRALRYLRMLGRADLPRFRVAARNALMLYRDAHLEKPEQFLDAWGLVHLLYWGSPVLFRDPRGVRLRPGYTLAQLEPAPLHSAAWQGQFAQVLELLERAPSGTVRNFALTLLKRDYEADLKKLPLARLKSLIASRYEEVQSLGAEYLRTAPGLARLPVSDWLELLRTDNLAVLGIVCDLIAAHVTPDRLTLAQAVELAVSKAGPVAELGLRWAKTKPVRSEADLRALLPLRNAGVPRVRDEGVAYLVTLLSGEHGTAEDVRDLLDSRFSDVRAKGFAMLDGVARFRDDMGLWSALAETPYDDARAFLVKHLNTRRIALAPGTLRHLWATLLLAIHRGSRTKSGVLRQIAWRAVTHPGEVDRLLPMVAFALRSVRPPERRSALGALARAAHFKPALRDAIEKHLPELKLSGEVAV